jgi:hypothetical protein
MRKNTLKTEHLEEKRENYEQLHRKSLQGGQCHQ